MFTQRSRLFAPLLLTAMSLIVTGAWLVISSEDAEATHREHRIIVGLSTTDAVVTTWYFQSPHTDASLDLIKTFGGDAGSNVYWQSNHVGGTTGIRAQVLAPLGSCKQTRVQVRAGDVSNIALGTYRYTHVDYALSLGTTWTASANNSWTVRFVGRVASTDAPGCSTGIHLHQGSVGGAAVFDNASLPSVAATHAYYCPTSGCRIAPTGDIANRWVHRFQW
ncbi:MAG TPA: hypothetical protein QGF05_00830 [Dehalococcoidia bacterium]|nr:hypothetical protein [Dehalococcoidia bacterium]